MEQSSTADPANNAKPKVRARDDRLDALRGLALVLMFLDHALVVLIAADGPHWLTYIRGSITRLSLPLFMVTSGFLMNQHRGFSKRRRIQVLVAALWINFLIFVFPVGFGNPDILALWLFVALFWKLIVKYPVETLTLGMIQNVSATLHLPSHNYQPGYVAAWLALGVIIARLPQEPGFLKHAGRLPRWVKSIGRNPLAWYVGHLTLFVYFGVMLKIN